MADEQRPKDSGESQRQAWAYVDAAWQLVGSVGLCTAGGFFADKHFHTTPWLLVAGSMLGFAAGMMTFFRTVLGTGSKSKGKGRQ